MPVVIMTASLMLQNILSKKNLRGFIGLFYSTRIPPTYPPKG